jgi:hypothetical protein
MLLMFRFRSHRCLLSRFPPIWISVITIWLGLWPSDWCCHHLIRFVTIWLVLSPSYFSLNFAFSLLRSPLHGTLSLGLEHSGCEVVDSPLSSCELKTEYSYTVTIPYTYRNWCLLCQTDPKFEVSQSTS